MVGRKNSLAEVAVEWNLQLFVYLDTLLAEENEENDGCKNTRISYSCGLRSRDM
jgi:hypothetical protein